MNIITTILAILGSIVILFLVIALLIKKEFSLERNIVINKSRQDIFNYAKLLKNQEKYSVWVMKEGESFETEIRFKKPFEATNYALTAVTDAGNGQTKISTIFSGKSKFPMNVMNLFMDKLVGKDMQKNLENMKANLEK